MPAADLSAYLVGSNELSSSTKFDNMVTAIQNYLNSIDDAKVAANAAIAVSKLAAGSNGQFLTVTAGVPTWGAGAGATLVTALPGSPTDGQEIVLVDSTSAPTYAWRLRYVAAKATNKWIFTGGGMTVVAVTASESITSATYGDLTTVGPSFTVPVAGIYTIAAGASDTNNGGWPGWVSFSAGATAAADTWGQLLNGTAIPGAQTPYLDWTLAANDVVRVKYRGDGTHAHTYLNRVLRVTPVAIGG